MRKLGWIIGAIFFLFGTAAIAAAAAVPEIDPGMACSAIALLSCGLLILTSRHRRKK